MERHDASSAGGGEIRIRKDGRDRVLVSRLTLPADIDDVFSFFSDARNLERITPPWLRFRVLTPGPIRMQVGAVIEYRLRVRGIPVRWRTRITGWDPPHSFEDDQERGPYRLWRHTHTFVRVAGGTMSTDIVRYRAPLSVFSHRWIVDPDVRRIFEARASALLKIFTNGI